MLLLNSELMHSVSVLKLWIAPIGRGVQLFGRAVEANPTSAVFAVAIVLGFATVLDWYFHTEFGEPGFNRSRRSEPQQISLKGRAGQTIGSVKMSRNKNLESFVEDLTALNQIVRGGQPGPSARLEVTQLKCLQDELSENRNQYSTFTGSLCIGTGCVPVQGLAKIHCRKDMICPEVEFESAIGKFRIELPEIPKVLGSRSLKFNVDIGLGREQTEA